jgi:hypothetical protein
MNYRSYKLYYPKEVSFLKTLKKTSDSVKILMFELRKAIGERNQLKPTQLKISANNPKENPWWLPLVWFWFYQLFKYHGLKDRNRKMSQQLLS